MPLPITRFSSIEAIGGLLNGLFLGTRSMPCIMALSIGKPGGKSAKNTSAYLYNNFCIFSSIRGEIEEKFPLEECKAEECSFRDKEESVCSLLGKHDTLSTFASSTSLVIERIETRHNKNRTDLLHYS